MTIAQLKRALLDEYPTFGHVINSLKINIKSEPRLFDFITETDGKVLNINKATFGQMPKHVQVFGIMHEICHIAFKHVQRGQDKEAFLWNVAADAVVNQLLAKDGHVIPVGSINIPGAENFTVEELYKKLQEMKKNPEGKKKLEKYKGQCNGHGGWKKGKLKKFMNKVLNEQQLDKLPEKKKNKKEQTEKSKKPDKADKNEDNEMEDEGEGGDEIDERKSFEKNEQQKQEKQEWREGIDQLSEEFERGGLEAGKGAGNKLSRLGEVGEAERIVNWKKLLRAALEDDDEVWGHKLSIKENRYRTRIQDHEVDEKIFTEVVIDTSGSVDDELARSFLSQLKVLIRDSDLKVGCFDDDFYGFTEIKKAKDIDRFEVIGRGGTNFDVAVNAFSKKADNKIVFTDGYAPMPQREVKAIWIVYGGRRIAPAGGTVIMVSEDKILQGTRKREDLIEI